MTTLPPEGQDGQPTGGQPTPEQPPAPTTPPAAPTTPPTAPPSAPQPPAAPEQPTGAPQYQAPQQPPAAPQQPQQPAAPQQPQAPQYQAPAGGQTPPPGGTQQPPAGYAQPVQDPASTITLNYWLSVFFVWIPALIFFIIEKDKGNQLATAYHRENLNFSLVRTGVIIATGILSLIPYLGFIIAILGWIAGVVLFVFHIMAAAKAPEDFRRGAAPSFIFNIPFIK